MMHGLENWWGVQSARINAMSLRERIFIFAAFIAATMALADTLWLSPAQARYQKLAQQIDRQSTELQRARTDLKAAGEPVGATKNLREDIATVTAGIDAVNRAIKGMSPSELAETPLARVLVHVLRRQEGLTLVRVTTLAPDASGSLTIPAGSAAGVLPAGWLTRQGVELTVSGPYSELTRYLEMLEKVLPHMRWGTMTLKNEKGPPELTLQLFLVGAKP